VYSAEYGDASGTAVFDVRERKWASRMCRLISEDLESKLPPLIASGAVAGKVSKSAADLYGINEGTLVATGGGDNMMSAIGTGAVKDGFLTMSLGTSGTLFGYSKTPVIDPTGNLSAFCSSTGGWLPLMCTNNCTVASEEFRALFGLDVKAFEAEAEKAPIGAEGIVVLPFFNGERTPNLPNGRASINGIAAGNFKRENLARAALESAIFGMRIGLEGFYDQGFKAKEIRLTGGGAKSPLWQSIAANVLNLPLRVPARTEAAAMGGAIQALWCLLNNSPMGAKKVSIKDLAEEHISLEGASSSNGSSSKDGVIIKPDKKAVAAYNKAYTKYSRYLKALSPLYK
jgi:xylulokinase